MWGASLKLKGLIRRSRAPLMAGATPVLIFIASHAQAALDVSPFFNQPLEMRMLEPAKAESIVDTLNDEKAAGRALSSYTLIKFGYQICVNSDGSPCTLEYENAETTRKILAARNGEERLEGEAATNPKEAKVTTVTTAAVEGNELVLQVQLARLDSGGGSNRRGFLVIRARSHSEFKSVRIGLSDAAPAESTRATLSDESDSFVRTLADSVVQIAGLETQPGHVQKRVLGSAFAFLKRDLLLTNYHVLDRLDGCLKQYKCRVAFRKVQADGKERRFAADVTVLTASFDHDLALIQVAFPSDMDVVPLQIEEATIGPDVVSAGFPLDTRTLTFHRGKITALKDTGFITTGHTESGGSGGPLLNPTTLKVVGIVAGVEASRAKAGPGSAYSIHQIESVLQLNDYGSGEKQKRLTSLLADLKRTTLPGQAETILGRLAAERSFLGIAGLKDLLVQHATPSVRKLILEHLESGGVLLGPSAKSVPSN